MGMEVKSGVQFQIHLLHGASKYLGGDQFMKVESDTLLRNAVQQLHVLKFKTVVH